ncbi:MAG: hypothetical protein ACLTEU_12300 [Roseburia inulinivorans]
MERSLDLYQSINGAFDIAIYPVMKAWGFTDIISGCRRKKNYRSF